MRGLYQLGFFMHIKGSLRDLTQGALRQVMKRLGSSETHTLLRPSFCGAPSARDLITRRTLKAAELLQVVTALCGALGADADCRRKRRRRLSF